MSIRLYVLLGGLTFAHRILAETDSIQQAPTKGFTVAVIQGDGVVNALPRPLSTHVSIRVADPKGQPIRDAVAVFEFPEAGASATFPDGSLVKVLLTNSNGEATAILKSNEVPGKYEPIITVNYLGQSSVLKLRQENVFAYSRPAPAKRGFVAGIKGGLSRKALIAIGAAGGAVAVLASHRSPAPPPPASSGGITVTPGTGTVGGR
jgi:hypothetical protein